MVPWAHTRPQPKQHVDRFRRFVRLTAGADLRGMTIVTSHPLLARQPISCYYYACRHPLCLSSPSIKMLAALLRVAGVTAGLAESNGSLPPGL